MPLPYAYYIILSWNWSFLLSCALGVLKFMAGLPIWHQKKKRPELVYCRRDLVLPLNLNKPIHVCQTISRKHNVIIVCRKRLRSVVSEKSDLNRTFLEILENKFGKITHKKCFISKTRTHFMSLLQLFPSEWKQSSLNKHFRNQQIQWV